MPAEIKMSKRVFGGDNGNSCGEDDSSQGEHRKGDHKIIENISICAKFISVGQ